MANAQEEKRIAAAAAVEHVKEGMIVGLGTGSTAYFAVQLIGERVQKGLSIKAIPTSEATATQARSLGIPLVGLEEVDHIDVTIDGADEFDNYLQLIKGGGGALLREKIVATHSNVNIIIADSSKKVDRLGAFPLPIEVIPFSEGVVWNQLAKLGLEGKRREKDNRVFVTDEGNHIFDLDIRACRDLTTLDQQLLAIPGVVETGLFLGLATKVYCGIGEEVVTY